MPSWLSEFFQHVASNIKLDTWSIIGLVGMATFSSRFIIQWIASEIKKESVIPLAFWHLSIVGSLVMLTYAVKRADAVFIIMYFFNCFIYGRNLYFIYKKKRSEIAV
jgi:lipid-A-disaccharide synthase-like uncharacterized protein